MDATARLLATAFRHVVNEPAIELARARFAALTGGAVGAGAFHDAVSACLSDGLIHEPVRLVEGALQCHWHLQLTPRGGAAARALLAAQPES